MAFNITVAPSSIVKSAGTPLPGRYAADAKYTAPPNMTPNPVVAKNPLRSRNRSTTTFRLVNLWCA
eukprot:CAMPEP_0176451246 /NCGR_PEP_ID=MMETSP0127-20121128/27707_1 /TAXON_ID=938130 /ORGANISM="Platyophrya macrostoma, Strain WH" /LENGTH=65 /DNA_ID=CAMNT_0017839235 /DNA_START=169 /DNA_END=366 /DNA_ORIENTATION=+